MSQILAEQSELPETMKVSVGLIDILLIYIQCPLKTLIYFPVLTDHIIKDRSPPEIMNFIDGFIAIHYTEISFPIVLRQFFDLILFIFFLRIFRIF